MTSRKKVHRVRHGQLLVEEDQLPLDAAFKGVREGALPAQPAPEDAFDVGLEQEQLAFRVWIGSVAKGSQLPVQLEAFLGSTGALFDLAGR